MAGLLAGVQQTPPAGRDINTDNFVKFSEVFYLTDVPPDTAEFFYELPRYEHFQYKKKKKKNYHIYKRH